MFRVSQFMHEIKTPPRSGRAATCPVVIWNLIRRCNLTCTHCYSISGDVDFPGELSTEEVFRVMEDLHAAKVRVLILSGGEPLLRPDIFEISRRAKEMGFYVGLSSNGTLIDRANAARIAEMGYDYVGISLDGLRATHDRIRRRAGAFDASLEGLRACRDLGIKVGMRFTIPRENAAEFPSLLQLQDDEGIDKFYLSHLNYAGRGNKNRGEDAVHAMSRAAMDLFFETCLSDVERGGEREYVTGNNDADGVYFLFWARERFPEHEAHLRAKLAQWGRQFLGREHRQYRQSRPGPSRHDVVALFLGQCARAALRRDLERPLRPADGGPEGAPARGHRALRRMRLFRHLRRQYPRARASAHRRFLGRGPGLLPRQCGDRRHGGARLEVTPFRGVRRRVQHA